MKSKKKSDEKAQVIEIEIEGNLEDLLTEEELKQLRKDLAVMEAATKVRDAAKEV